MRIILLQIIFHIENVIFFGVFHQKPRTADSPISKLSTKGNQVFQKEPRKQNFYGGPSFRIFLI